MQIIHKIILADDHNLFRAGLKKLIEEKGSYEIIDEASNGEELLNKLSTTKCELIITDLSMPKLNGLEALKIIKKKYPDIKIMILSQHKEREYFRKVLSLGVEGYILKDDVYEKMMSAIKSILSGRKSYSDELTSYAMEDYKVLQESEIAIELLTKREKEVLIFIAEGHTNKEIAERLDISFRTVEAHRAHLMDKLDFENVQDLVKFAVSKGLV